MIHKSWSDSTPTCDVSLKLFLLACFQSSQESMFRNVTYLRNILTSRGQPVLGFYISEVRSGKQRSYFQSGSVKLSSCVVCFFVLKKLKCLHFLYLVQGRIIWKSQPRFNIHHVSLCHQKQKPERTTTPQNPKQPTDPSLSFKRRRLTKTQQTAVSRLKLLHRRCTHHVSFFFWTGTSYQSDVGSLLDEQSHTSPRRSFTSKKFEKCLTDLWPELVSAENYKLYSVAARSA